MAHLSGDASLRRAFAEDRDVHQATAAEVFGVAPELVTADQRRSAKAINFGLMYGMSAFGLARQLGIARGDAQKYMDLYFERYPGVKRYMEERAFMRAKTGYMGDCVWPAALSSGDSVAKCGPAPIRRGAVRSMRPCRALQRHHQARHDRVDAWLQTSRVQRQSSCKCATNW